MSTLQDLLDTIAAWDELPDDAGPGYQLVRAHLPTRDLDVLSHHLESSLRMFGSNLLLTKGSTERGRTISIWTKAAPAAPIVSLIIKTSPVV